MAAAFGNANLGASTGVRSGVWKAWQATSKAAEPLFFANNSQRSCDQLVEVVRREPAMGARVLQGVTFFSVLGNFVVTVAILTFLSCYWCSCGGCDRPLRWWLLMLSVLQSSQIPVRVVFLASVRKPVMAAIAGNGAELVARVTSITNSPAWCFSKKLALVQYAWFVLGMVWWMHSSECPGCPGIGKLTAGVMFLVAGRAAIAMAVVAILFTPARGASDDEASDDAADRKGMMAATPKQIAALPVVLFELPASPSAKLGEGTAGTSGDEDCGPSCSICLTEFADGAVMRRLPCGHDFHRRCVDKWLQQNKRCPLCMHPVDEPTPTSALSAGEASPWSASPCGAACCTRSGRSPGFGNLTMPSPKGAHAGGRAT